MQNIEAATNDLVAHCREACPACHAPGFVVREVMRGLPCRACGTPTDEPALLRRSCQLCGHTAEAPATEATSADPGDCPYCNP
jgi:hypothetical protein